jgi:hypothetical protein
MASSCCGRCCAGHMLLRCATSKETGCIRSEAKTACVQATLHFSQEQASLHQTNWGNCIGLQFHTCQS